MLGKILCFAGGHIPPQRLGFALSFTFFNQGINDESLAPCVNLAADQADSAFSLHGR